MSHAAETPTIWFKNKRVWRTIFSWFVGALTVLPIVLGIINEQFPAEWIVWVITQLGAVQAILTRIMANETINLWLSRIGLGSAPKEYLVSK